MSNAAALSALQAGQNAFTAVGNNIANTQTNGAKRESAAFSSVLAGVSMPNTFVAGGVNTNNIRYNNEQGLMENTSSTTDIAIGGNGFFVVSSGVVTPGQNGASIGYTRAGQYQPDNNGYLMNVANGQYLLGWATDGNGNPTQSVTGTLTSLQSIQVNANVSLTNPTSQLTLGLNLPSTDPVAQVRQSSVQVYDSLGASHTLTISWTKTSNSPNTWTASITSPTATSVEKNTVGSGTPYATMTVIFNGQGQPVSFDGNPNPPNIAIKWNGAANNSIINLNLGTVNTSTGVTCNAGNFEIIQTQQDGKEIGKFSGVNIDDNGVVTAVYTNGETLMIYRVALAMFAAPNDLAAQIGNVFLQTNASGTFNLGFANQNGFGSIQSNALEQSTVDLATELTDMMAIQRYYSSNTQVIKADQDMFTVLLSNLRSS